VGDILTVTVAMTIDDGTHAPDPDLTLPPEFDLISSRSSTSTSISIIQGAVTQTKTLNVLSTVRANKEGTFTIGPAGVESGGKTIRSQTLRVQVVKGLSKPRATATASRDAVSADQLKEIEENLFIRATPDRNSVYVGEQILLSYDLYSRYRIQNPRFGVVPPYTGFWAESVFEASRLEQRSEVVNGRTFKKSRLKQVALFPTIPGVLKLEQLEFICDVPLRSRRRSVFDVDDFFSWDPFRSRQVTVRAPDLEIEVRSLPGGAPESFSGGVGVFDISATVSNTKMIQGDPVTVKVVVGGRGNIHGVGEPLRPRSSKFKFYDPKGTAEAQFQGTVLTGSKTFEYVAIPTANGHIALPPFELAYFDPERERYVIKKTEPIFLNVTPSKRVEQVSMTSTAGTALKLMGEDIRYIKADAANLEDHADYLHTSSLFWSLHTLPVLGLLVAWQWRRRQLKLTGDVAYARKRRSKGEAQKRLAEARRQLAAEGALFYSEVYRALSAFLADRVNLMATDLTAEQARRALAAKSVDPALIDRVVGMFEACDYARFALGPGSTSDREILLSQTEALIDALEQAT
jgi:hypothetical protein